jgi:hypothetical protein
MVRRPNAPPNCLLKTTIRYRQRTSDAKPRFDGPSLSTLGIHSLEDKIEPSSKICLVVSVNAMSQASVSSDAKQRLLSKRVP